MMASYIKKSTGLVGLAVSKTPRQTLTKLYRRTLEVLGTMPGDATYRTQTEEIMKQRLNLVEQETNVEALEKKIGAGQIEEVIRQAEDELSLAKKMEGWKPWEPLESPPPPGQLQWP